MMAVNAKGLFFTAQAAGRVMLAQGSGQIVAISSQASLVGIRDHVVYSTSKGAVNQIVRVLALEWGGARGDRERRRPDLRLHAGNGRTPRRPQTRDGRSSNASPSARWARSPMSPARSSTWPPMRGRW